MRHEDFIKGVNKNAARAVRRRGDALNTSYEAQVDVLKGFLAERLDGIQRELSEGPAAERLPEVLTDMSELAESLKSQLSVLDMEYETHREMSDAGFTG